MEHRIQLRRMHRTHLIPTQERELEILGRSLNMRRDSANTVVNAWKNTRRDVRSLHEDIFYRPLLPATARLSADEASLAPKAAQARLRAIGYRDPAGAMRHITVLTEGVTRRASIQRHLLPVMIGWFAEGAYPDAGLLAFRKLSEELGTTHWYLKMLRDSGQAAYRLAYLLSTSTYIADALSKSPESVAWLDNDVDVTIHSKERLASELDAILTRADDPTTATTLIRAIRRRELARTATAKLLDSQNHALSPTESPTLRTSQSMVRCASRDTLLPSNNNALNHQPSSPSSPWGAWADGKWGTGQTPMSCLCTNHTPAMTPKMPTNMRSR